MAVAIAVKTVSGIWKFSDSVGHDALVKAASAWKKAEPDNFKLLHIRRCSKNQMGIVFIYEYEGKNYKKFFHRILGQLKAEFGPKLAGWDMSSDIFVIS